METEMQKEWEEERVFYDDAPEIGTPERNQPKFFPTFPYPYMNGRLHLGHSFSLSKCEFACGYEKLKGKRVVFPFGFHCTGMPIKACADKLKREIETFGNPPVFPSEEEDVEVSSAPSAGAGAGPVMKKKSKVAAKSSGKKYQWEIMRSMGVAEDEIAKFADAHYWLYYFPPHAMNDLRRLGVKVDWRRSFITTDVNPYYDSFVKWQFRKLKALDRVKFGKRYTIFSPLDNQPCMDHDRQTGEGVAPQEYTLIKLEVVSPFPEFLQKLSGKRVSLVAATLRPETMYGQTNCFVGPSLEYAAFEMGSGEIFICTERSMINLSYQGFTAETGKVKKIMDFVGQDLVSLAVKAPLSKYEKVFVLPMESVLATKGTGVVTSVPSDSPDDYANLIDLKKKPAFYGINEEWVATYEPIPIIETPSFGNLAAPIVCQQMKINSPKDRKQLDLAKEKVYQEGFYKGKLIVGEFAGKSVQEAKPLIRDYLINIDLACVYWEPENLVTSRSGDECVVALTDQWYLNYGEEHWKQDALKCLEKMEVFHPEVRNSFIRTLDWLKEWACSRSYGLGSRLPWDEQWLIESLSDSTIYMAYYTISHFLQGNALDGSKGGSSGIKPEQLTDEVWDYIFGKENVPLPKSTIPSEILLKLKSNFSYFYPMDLRVSGKDLVPNHLTFSIYNHVALFDQEYWPKAMRANGHLLINNEKMSKSTGNFLTLVESVEKFSADATRFALAEAGDGVEDANFEYEIANAAILRLYTLKDWIEEHVLLNKDGKLRKSQALDFHDRVFESELNKLIVLADEAYTRMNYHDVLKYAFHQFINARDRYVLMSNILKKPLHQSLVERYIETQLIVIGPIVSHFSDFIWRRTLLKPHSIFKQGWPKVGTIDESVLAANQYVEKLVRDTRLAIINETQPKKKKIPTPISESVPPNAVEYFVSQSLPSWKSDGLEAVREAFHKNNNIDMKTLMETLKVDSKCKLHLKNKKFLPFVKEMLDLASKKGEKALDLKLPFNETEVFNLNAEFIKLSLNISDIKLTPAEVVEDESKIKKANSSEPGEPSFMFFTK